MALSQFYGMVLGRAKTSRNAIGTKTTGLVTRARTRDGEIRVDLAWDDRNKCDLYQVTLEFYHKKAMKKIILAKGSF